MSKQDTGGPAFPVPLTDAQEAAWNEAKLPSANGMTLRDYFAAEAMQALLVDAECGPNSVKDFAESAYIMADAMLKAREQ